MLKRRFADRADWSRVLARRFLVRQYATEAFQGYVTLLRIDAIREPFWVTYPDHRLCTADCDYTWVQHFPTGCQHTLTTMFDATGQVVQWYIDICAAHGIDARGIPWFDDLYIDIVIQPPQTIYVLDMDELEAARMHGHISDTMYSVALRETQQVLEAIEQQSYRLLDVSVLHRDELERQLSVPKA